MIIVMHSKVHTFFVALEVDAHHFCCKSRELIMYSASASKTTACGYS